MFVMTANVTVDGFKPFKVSSINWTRSVDNIVDNASFVLPALCSLVDKKKSYSNVTTGLLFKEGNRVTIEAGYDGKNKIQFVGYISRINLGYPIVVELENAGYLLKHKVKNWSFKRTKLKAVLQTLVAGTGINLSPNIKDIGFEPAFLENYTSIQVLEWIKKNYNVNVCFFGNVLYVGLTAGFVSDKVTFHLGWNVAKDDGLNFRSFEGSKVKYVLESRNADGTRTIIKPNNENSDKAISTKVIKTKIQDPTVQQDVINHQNVKQNQKGWEGNFTAFLIPHVEPGNTVDIVDKKFAERSGQYFVNSVKGSFDSSGGRQQIELGYKL